MPLILRGRTVWRSTIDRWGRGALPGLALLLLGALAAPARAAPAPAPLGRPASAPAELAISFETAAVLATGLTPGGDAVFWSVAREPLGYDQRVVERRGIVVVDALGEARFDLREGEVPLKSVWTVVDVAGGKYGIAAPPGFRLRPIPFPEEGFKAEVPGRVNRLLNGLASIYSLVVRPGVGAWRLRAWDRSSHDRDATDDDRVLISLTDLEPVEGTGADPPVSFARGDVVVVIDPESLRFYSLKLPEAPRAGGGEP